MSAQGKAVGKKEKKGNAKQNGKQARKVNEQNKERLRS